MDYDSSTKFISSLAKFLQSLCNGYVEFDSGVQVIGHLYLSVDTGKTIDYILNEKVCKTDENSVTFISNSFHAQPAERPKAQGKKIIEKDSKPEDANDNQTSLPEPKSTNFGTLPTRGAQNSPHSQNFKRAFSPSSKRTKDGSSPSKLGRLSPKHKKNRTESLDQNVSSQISNPASENSISSQPSPTTDGITAPISAQSTEAVHGSQYTDSYQQNFFQTGEDDNSMVDESEERDIKPSIDTDVTFIKEEFAPSSCSQSSNQNRDRTHGEDSSAYYHSNQTFPASFAGQTGFGGTVRTNFNSSSERSSLYPGSSQLEAENSGDPSGDFLETSLMFGYIQPRSAQLCGPGAKSTSQNNQCNVCGKIFTIKGNLDRHRWKCLDLRQQPCPYCHRVFHRRDNLKTHLAKCGMASNT
ncbi:uncharacterized protein LOC106064207 isoform X16 [Biomphalaria glabrata]|uniref:Uncharacterized protein LOC106064207 isoform X16 n=1 Tax=Biomphalaria glabrata TaxID=6526 RepID=A0A9W3B7N2_BIOGL|nr:uncharacterized protein LOC106064207 isoform X16 [Biomphalaria glabrata]